LSNISSVLKLVVMVRGVAKRMANQNPLVQWPIRAHCTWVHG